MIAAEREYASALAAPAPDGHGRLRLVSGASRPLPFGRFLGSLTAADRAVLARVRGRVLDVGCGPGRHVQALRARGVPAMGIDASPAAVAIARERGTLVHHGSVFEDVPGAGGWDCALLLDGNVGIGGCPVRLLGRVRSLLRPDGLLLAEVDPPGWPSASHEVRLEGPAGVSAPFAWAVLGVDGLPAVAAASGFVQRDLLTHDGRWFAELIAAS